MQLGLIKLSVCCFNSTKSFFLSPIDLSSCSLGATLSMLLLLKLTSTSSLKHETESAAGEQLHSAPLSLNREGLDVDSLMYAADLL